MGRITKKRKEAIAKVEKNKLYSLQEASALLKEITYTKFDASVDLAVRLGVDPRKANQMVRGVVSLPHGTGKVLPVVISVYKDKSFDFVIKTPPAAVQLLEAAKVKKGSGEPNRKKVAKVTWDQVKAIAEDKMQDLNAFEIGSAMKMVV